MELEERTIGGLHDFLLEWLPERSVREESPQTVDLGGGSGALGLRLRDRGYRVTIVDLAAERFGADLPFVHLDLNTPDLAERLGAGSFDLVSAVEVIEHLESPIGFLRNVGALLKPAGRAVLTTPNVDSAPSRVKFLLTGKLRMMDERSDPTHISPVFADLFVRQWLPRAGLRVVAHAVYPPGGHRVTRPAFRPFFTALTRLLRGDALSGDCHVWLLALRAAPSGGSQGRVSSVR